MIEKRPRSRMRVGQKAGTTPKPRDDTASGLTSLGRPCLCWLYACEKVSTHRSDPRRLVDMGPTTTTREYRLASSTVSCSFPVSEVMFQFPRTVLLQDCRLRLHFKYRRDQATTLESSKTRLFTKNSTHKKNISLFGIIKKCICQNRKNTLFEYQSYPYGSYACLGTWRWVGVRSSKGFPRGPQRAEMNLYSLLIIPDKQDFDLHSLLFNCLSIF